MYYAMIGEDAPGTLQTRLAVRPEHVARLEAVAKSAGGPALWQQLAQADLVGATGAQALSARAVGGRLGRRQIGGVGEVGVGHSRQV